MLWPPDALDRPPPVQLPEEYGLRSFRQGDQSTFYKVMDLSGWPRWNDETLDPWLKRIIPDGWFMIFHEDSGDIAATCMALHHYRWLLPFSGELGWLASDPAHAGKALGLAAAAAVTSKFIEVGYDHINLYTEDFRLPAIKTYLKLGYVPFLNTDDMPDRWQTICDQLHWPFDPDTWRSTLSRYPVEGRQ